MKQERLARMIALATASHNEQYDKGGAPYILHPLTVMHMLHTTDEELKCIAVGHDLLEDTDVTTCQLEQLMFGSRIINGILALTRLPGQSREKYKQQVVANADAVRVKMCDLRHNSDIRRLKGVTQRDLDRVNHYMAFYEELKAL